MSSTKNIFEVPSSYFTKISVIYISGVILLVVLLPLFGIELASMRSTSAISIYMLFVLVQLWSGKQQLFVRVTSAGIEGKTALGKDITIKWRDYIELSRSDVLLLPGFQLVKGCKKSMLDQYKSIFIAETIVLDESFRKMVLQYAPELHPLREHIIPVQDR